MFELYSNFGKDFRLEEGMFGADADVFASRPQAVAEAPGFPRANHAENESTGLPVRTEVSALGEFYMETGQIGDTTYLFDSKENRYFGEPHVLALGLVARVGYGEGKSRRAHTNRLRTPEIGSNAAIEKRILRYGTELP